jgi:hypothetical protein
MRCFFNWYVDLAGHISVWEDKIDRGKNSDPEKNMLSCPLWHISIKRLHVIKAIVLYITTLMCELLSKLLHLVCECLQL